MAEAAAGGGGLPATLNPVEPAGLRRLWELWQDMQTRYPAPPGGGCVGIDLRSLEAEFTGLDLPGADPLALWLRVAFVSFLQKVGALKEWEQGADLNDVVFQVAATFPFAAGMDVESFREQIRKASGPNI